MGLRERGRGTKEGKSGVTVWEPYLVAAMSVTVTFSGTAESGLRSQRVGWEVLSQKKINSWVESMPQRLRDVIRLEG